MNLKKSQNDLYFPLHYTSNTLHLLTRRCPWQKLIFFTPFCPFYIFYVCLSDRIRQPFEKSFRACFIRCRRTIIFSARQSNRNGCSSIHKKIRIRKHLLQYTRLSRIVFVLQNINIYILNGFENIILMFLNV